MGTRSKQFRIAALLAIAVIAAVAYINLVPGTLPEQRKTSATSFSVTGQGLPPPKPISVEPRN